MNPFTSLYFAWMRLRNSLDFPIRQHLHFSSRPVVQTVKHAVNILDTYPPEEQARVNSQISRLRAQYHFDYYEKNRRVEEIKENFFYLAMLDSAFEQSQTAFPPNVTAADIGPSSWFYVHALHAALTWYQSSVPRTVHLTGYEMDAFRLYSDFHTRRDHALGNMQGLAGIEYREKGFEILPSTCDLITLFFPFVFLKDHLEWGLPGNLFEPMDLLNTAWNSLKPGGLLLIVNQGLEEHTAELKNLEHLGIKPTASIRMEPLLYSYSLERFIITVKR